MPFPPMPAPLAHALATRGYDDPTDVQAAVLDPDLAGRDLLVSAQTGSGKTVAFGLAMAGEMLDGQDLAPAGPPSALVIAPTRELAQQVQSELAWLYGEAGARVIACVGGMDPRREQRLLASGAHIVVGTPGRLRDHIERRQLNLAGLRVAVLDEADEMLDLGFREDLEFILEAAPADRRTLLFSATIPREIAALAGRFQRDARRLAVGASREAHADITYTALRVASGETIPAIINVLRFHEAPVAIVFCPTREAVRTAWSALVARGFDAVALSGEMGQFDRNQALQALRSGRARVCVATDVAARGLDLPELSLVIHAELPMNASLLLHRSGRTGRAGRKGASVVLVTPQRLRRADALLRQAGVNAEWQAVPDAEAVRRRDHARLTTDPILTDAPSEAEAQAAAELAAGHDAAGLAVALLRLHRARLPQEEDVTRLTGGSPMRGKGEPQNEAARGRAERGHARMDKAVWLSASVGRRDKADPKWLLPLLCRMGGVQRDQIGAIRIMTEETRFEVPDSSAEFFLENAGTFDRGDLRIARSSAPPDRPGSGPAKARPGNRANKPHAPSKQRWRTSA